MPLPATDKRTSGMPGIPALIWWVIWIAILTGLGMIYFVVGRRIVPATDTTAVSVMAYISAGPLLLSALVRWLWFPRIARAQQALPIFILGVALAESTGILGIFLTSQPETFAVLGGLGIVQWMPLFTQRFAAAPQRS